MIGFSFGGYIGSGSDYDSGDRPPSKFAMAVIMFLIWAGLLFFPCMAIYQCMEAADVKDVKTPKVQFSEKK